MSLIATGLASLLIESGPTLIRSMGGLFGSRGQKAAEVTATIVESVAGVKNNKAAEAVVEAKLQELPHDALVELENIKLQLEKIKAEREKNQMDFDLGVHQATQQTIQKGDEGGGEYVKQTRPKVARLSAYASFIYALGFELLAAFDKGDGANAYILATLFSPCLTYMGVRTAEAFSRFKGWRL